MTGRYLGILTSVVMLLAVPSVDAQAAEHKLAVMPLSVVRAVDPGVATMLTQALTMRAAKMQGYEVMSADEVQAILGMERLKDALGCDDVSCAAELGGALGSDLMLTGTVGKLGSKLTISLTLFDVTAVKVLSRAQQSVPDEEDRYEAAVATAFADLFGDEGQNAEALGGLAEQQEQPAVVYGAMGVFPENGVQAAPDGPWAGRRRFGQVCTYTGAGLLAFGALATALSYSAAKRYSSSWSATDASASKTWAALMYTGYISGGVILGTGLWAWLLAPDSTNAATDEVSFWAAPTSSGLAFGVGGRWH